MRSASEFRFDDAFGKYDEERDTFLVAYEAIQGDEPEDLEVTGPDPPKEETGFGRSAARAVETALEDFVEGFEGEQRPDNVAVLPAEGQQFRLRGRGRRDHQVPRDDRRRAQGVTGVAGEGEGA